MSWLKQTLASRRGGGGFTCPPRAHTPPPVLLLSFIEPLFSIYSFMTTDAIHRLGPIVFLMIKFLPHLLFSLDSPFVIISVVFHKCVISSSHAPQQAFKSLSVFGRAVPEPAVPRSRLGLAALARLPAFCCEV